MPLTQKEKDWAAEQLDEYIRVEDMECADNFRFADKLDIREIKEYDKIKLDGCCGFFDIELFYRPTKKWILIGCNFGH